ncbi:hypothetical protein EJB05_32654 [Eragrostis curvula]|uniref:GDSL esterase/lipase n=1 Tax=Eragrostis curvula TaxID=38414 RepID=A0A5J9UGS0_9POAL|nr:hypothetical protein EJB05_32654 [Eragrostis curvula]
MARFLPCAAVSLLLVVVLLSATPDADAASSSSTGRRYRYGSIFSFGDSYADTGNNPVAFRRLSLFDPVMRPPYGATFFRRPTGRDSDGRLAIDFIAESLGLPLVPPFLARERNGSTFRRGANFAVGGATAIDAAFFHSGDPPGGSTFPLNTSLGVQLQWFESIKPSLCGKGCKDFFRTSLFFVGAFGVNDYLLSLSTNNVSQVRPLVPDVITTISTAIERLIVHGASTLVVPGIIPFGCAPPVLVKFADRDPAGYDPRTGCLKGINELVTRHNTLLQEAVHELQAKHTAGDVKIVYTDFFGPVMEMLTSPAKFGFEDVFTLCCGGPGKYNYNPKIFCGDAAGIMCKDPSTRVFWDGVHLTEAAYRHIAAGWLSSIQSP